jgi:hypothetical protein
VAQGGSWGPSMPCFSGELWVPDSRHTGREGACSPPAPRATPHRRPHAPPSGDADVPNWGAARATRPEARRLSRRTLPA